MIRSRTLLALAGLAVVAGLAGCGNESANTPAKISAPSAAAPTASESLTAERLETIYLDATAAHLCSVQGQVYTDPSAMAEAFDSKPVYTTLTDAQVEEYQQRVIAEPAFATRLTDKITQTCGSTTK